MGLHGSDRVRERDVHGSNRPKLVMRYSVNQGRDCEPPIYFFENGEVGHDDIDAFGRCQREHSFRNQFWEALAVAVLHQNNDPAT